MPRVTAYLRVSTVDQDLEKNKADILRLANTLELGHVRFVEEKVSGKVAWRNRKIAEILDHATTGDTIIVSELSRLGRSMLECMEILSIAAQKGVNVYAVKGNWRLDTSIQSKIIAMAFAMAAEIERDLIAKRTKEALTAKKLAGAKLGRPSGVGKSKLDAFRPEIEALLNNRSTQKFIAERYHTTGANLRTLSSGSEASLVSGRGNRRTDHFSHALVFVGTARWLLVICTENQLLSLVSLALV